MINKIGNYLLIYTLLHSLIIFHILLLIAILFPYNEWASNFLIKIKIIEFYSLLFPENLNFLKKIYYKFPDNQEVYLASSVFSRITGFCLAILFFLLTWKIHLQHIKKFIQSCIKDRQNYISKYFIYQIFCFILCLWILYLAWFEGKAIRGQEIYSTLNFLDRALISFSITISINGLLKGVLFLYTVLTTK